MTQLISLLQAGIMFGTVILYGSTGETLTEKSGNLNLGVPGIMYLGGIVGLIGVFFYEMNNPEPNKSRLHTHCYGLGLCGRHARRAHLQRADCYPENQSKCNRFDPDHFCRGFANLWRHSKQIGGGVGQISVSTTSAAFRASLPFCPRFATTFEHALWFWLHGIPGYRGSATCQLVY